MSAEKRYRGTITENKAKEDICTVVMEQTYHRVIEYLQLEGTQKDPQSPTPGSAQDSPKNHTMCLRALSKCFLNSGREPSHSCQLYHVGNLSMTSIYLGVLLRGSRQDTYLILGSRRTEALSPYYIFAELCVTPLPDWSQQSENKNVNIIRNNCFYSFVAYLSQSCSSNKYQ
ncbi:hypothetical protein WISP_145470 [Willisornis vidua]|uniref:Uncharacterized protein n=1 Tax=Willisornis vidua TaxID=1566151 RepID=A0ABQ9CLZ4_9PASS|nr:hypothetical protein WISP_145470 [Willisornis vidua]